MNQLSFPIISLVTFFPIFGVLILLMIDKESEDILRGTAVAFTVIEFFISLPLIFYFNNVTHNMQFVELIPWVKSFGINYHMGIDGISRYSDNLSDANLRT